MQRKSIYCRVIHSHAPSSDSDSYLKLVIKLWSCCGIWLKKMCGSFCSVGAKLLFSRRRNETFHIVKTEPLFYFKIFNH